MALHTMREKGADVQCISEPINIPDNFGWIGSTDRKCALYFQQNLQVMQMGRAKVLHGPTWKPKEYTVVIFRQTAYWMYFMPS